MILGLLPVAGEIDAGGVIVDSKSGVSGAGRTPSEKTHFCAVDDNFRAYSEVGHRHTAEMVQELSAGRGRAPAGVVHASSAAGGPGHPQHHVLPAAERPGRELTPGWRSTGPSTRMSRSWRSCEQVPSLAEVVAHQLLPHHGAGGQCGRAGEGVHRDRQPGEGRLGTGGAEHELHVRVRRRRGAGEDGMSGIGRSGPSHPVVVAPLAVAVPHAAARAYAWRNRRAAPRGPPIPAGFLAGGVVAGLKDSGRPDMGVLAVAPEWRDEATSAAVFTTNAFAAAPIVVNRNESDLGHLLAVVDEQRQRQRLHRASRGWWSPGPCRRPAPRRWACRAANVAVGSTGIIGVQLDADFMAAGARKAAAAVKPGGGPEFNRRIMTTDRFPKMCALEVETARRARCGWGLRQGRRDDLAGHGDHAVRGDHRRGRWRPRTCRRSSARPSTARSTGSPSTGR